MLGLKNENVVLVISYPYYLEEGIIYIIWQHTIWYIMLGLFHDRD